MQKLKLTQDKYNELCCAGKLNFTNHDVYAVKWLTYFDLIAVSVDTRTDEKELISLQIE